MGTSPRNDRLAFTLSEVLITLGIIGIVAAITLPSIVSNINNIQLKKALKKDYSVVSQTMQVITNLYGGDITGSFNREIDAIDAFCLQAKCLKTCTYGDEEGCWHKPGEFSSPNGFNSHRRNRASAIFADGSLITINTSFNKNCDQQNAEAIYDNVCFDLLIDVNGFNKPNVIGRDIFRLVVLKNKVLPYGAFPGNTSLCEGELSSGWGDSCAAKYLLE